MIPSFKCVLRHTGRPSRDLSGQPTWYCLTECFSAVAYRSGGDIFWYQTVYLSPNPNQNVDLTTTLFYNKNLKNGQSYFKKCCCYSLFPGDPGSSVRAPMAAATQLSVWCLICHCEQELRRFILLFSPLHSVLAFVAFLFYVYHL